jgi:glyoxylase-like metal-dependent hydrolase (beta-lactamase superfamily II)
VGSGIYHTLAIEQSDKIVLIEAPENDATTLSAIAKVRQLRPAKSLGPLVNTHAHFDHAGGIRAAMSEGLTIVTHEANRDFFERYVHPRRHTLQADALERNPRPLTIVPVRGRYVLHDPVRPVELYEVQGSPHSQSIIFAYLPSERILIQADLDSPPAAPSAAPLPPFTVALVETVARLGLRVDRVFNIHGPPLPWSDRR